MFFSLSQIGLDSHIICNLNDCYEQAIFLSFVSAMHTHTHCFVAGFALPILLLFGVIDPKQRLICISKCDRMQLFIVIARYVHLMVTNYRFKQDRQTHRAHARTHKYTQTQTYIRQACETGNSNMSHWKVKTTF